jgi:hypothetical protein
MQEAEALRLIESTFAALDRWQVRGASPHVPASGSELADDDLDWPPFPVSQVATTSLAIACDHLLAIRFLVEQRRIFVAAELTLARAALVGASQAVWVLEDDHPAVRIERARCVAHTQDKNHRIFLTELAALADGGHEGTNEVANHTAKRENEIAAKRESDGQRSQLNATAMVRAAALATFTDEDMASEAQIEWRRSSGVAHGFRWALLGVPDTTLVSDSDDGGLAAFEAAGGLARYVNLYMCACRVLEKGWQLYDQRSSPAAESAPDA